MVKKDYDIIIHGATGFTGKLICDYLFNHSDSKTIKWAISGRNKSKLKPISEKYNIDSFTVDSFDFDLLHTITSKSKLIISVVGPYSIYGKKLVKSCVENNCHYLDITGESAFVKHIEKTYTKSAIENNTILISCCGFESIPPDIGTYYSVQKLKEKNVNIKCYMRTKGQISGGTWASFLNHFNKDKKNKNPSKNINRESNYKDKIIFYNKDLKKWALLFPDVDRYIINRSSNLISSYGNELRFTKYMLFPSIYKIMLLLVPLFFISILAKFKSSKKWLESFIPSGTGPSKQDRKKHWFKYTIIGKTLNQKIVTTVSGGDPGYGETSKFITEMALSIIIDYNKLNLNKGVLTPASCAGDIMLDRLKKSGITIKHQIYKV